MDVLEIKVHKLASEKDTRSFDLEKAARCGEPSYVWRAGQARRLQMVIEAAGRRLDGTILENGCGVGMYVDHLAPHAREIVGLEYDFQRALEAHQNVAQGLSNARILCAAGEGSCRNS